MTEELKKKIIEEVKNGKRLCVIAKELNLNSRSIGSYVRIYKHLTYDKCCETFFNVDLYTKETKTI